MPRTRLRRATLSVASFLALLVILLASVQASAKPRARTAAAKVKEHVRAEITNVATATYVDGRGSEVSLSSEPVTAVTTAKSAVKLSKAASTLKPAAGEPVTFSIRAAAGANPPASGVDTIVDGQPRTLFLLRDAIPAQTRFIRFAAVSSGTPLYHISGDPVHTYTATAPADLKVVDAVAIAVSEFPAGTALTLRFAVQLKTQVSGNISNTAELHAADEAGNTTSVARSNTVTLAPQAPPAPSGIVFDSKTNAPISDARVSLIDTATGTLARVFDANGNPAPATVITGADGRYSFPVLPPGSYRIEVLPPPGYVGPSQVAAANLPSGRNVDPSASYALAFLLDGSVATVLYDIPLDRAAAQSAGLFVQKLASREFAEIGDFVDYTVRVKNVTGRDLNDVLLEDELPHGFVMVADSARLEGKRRIRTENGSVGPRISFRLGEIEKDGMVTITYRLRIGVDARRGDGINRAQARSRDASRAVSNIASVRVQIEEGVFTTRGIVFGKVFVDANRNRIQDADGEPGIPGVRLYMEDGTYVITDSEGKFSLYGLTPRAHVLKVDRTTLPPGAELIALDHRNAGTGSTRFVDLKHGEMHKANFAIGNPNPEMLEHIAKLRAAAQKLAKDGDATLKTDLTRDGSPIISRSTDRRALPASGVIVPGVSVQPTQDMRTEGAESLILGGQRFNVLPAGGRDVRRPSAPLFQDMKGEQSLRENNAPLPVAPVNTQPLPVVPPASQPLPVEPVQPTLPPVVTRTTAPIPVPTAPVGENEQGANREVFDPVLPGLPQEGYDLTLFDPDRNPLVPTTEVPAEQSATVAAPAPAAAPQSPVKAPAGALTFLDLRDGDTLPMAQSNVRVQGRAGAKMSLKVNGEEVPAYRVGRRVSDNDAGTETVEYIGVPLKPGSNVLILSQLDPFGNPRGSETINVIAPDKLGRIKINLPAREVAADGRTPARVGVELLDAGGVPVTARTEVTLEASLGRWNVKDVNPTTPGVQTFIEGGRAEWEVLAPLEPGDCRLRVSAGELRADERLAFLPDLRPMLAAGIVEGRVKLSNFSANSLTRVENHDAFEQELRELSVGDDTQSAGVRAALFLKGKIKGDYLLTASYDSEREVRERLFRDIQPDEFYPVYGDASVKGFEAQSTGPLYVRVDKKRSYLLYGDFVTQATGGDFRQLGNYSRSLTGVKEHFENSRVSANAWAAYDSTKQIIEEQRANGTSGPYLFNIRGANGLTNSEKVEIITRDRNNPGLIIKSEPRTRFSDYEFEPFTGRILFRAPVPSIDEELNPVSIRVTYEADTGGPKFWTYGGDMQVKVAERFEIGGAFAREENPAQRFSIYSANAVWEVAPNTVLIGEWARTDDELLGAGNAYRGELRHLSESVAARLFWGKAESAFHNPSAMLQSGFTEGGAQIAVRVARNTRVLIEAVTSEIESGGERHGVAAAIEQTFGKDIRLELGGRYSIQRGGPATPAAVLAPGLDENEVRSVRAKLTVPVPFSEGRARIFGEYEQDIYDSEKRLAAIGGEYQVDAKTRLYARHELISSLGGPFDLNTLQEQNQTIIGVESTYAKDSQLFNEYRVRDGISGRENEAAIGLRNTWALAPGLRALTTFERVSPVGDTKILNESTAITGALEYTGSPDWKGTARLELRQSDNTDSLLNTFGLAWKLNEDWTALGKTILYIADNKAPGAGDQVQARVQLGAAWRQTETDRWNALGRYEFRTEDDATTLDFQKRRFVHILSADLNFQPNANTILSGHYAGKLAFERSGGINSTTSAHLVSGRAIRDISKRWDVGLNTSVIFDTGSGVNFGVGPEVGFLLTDNLRVGVGYNFIGFHDRDLSEGNYTERGFYLAVRFKFDEELWQRRKKEKLK